MSSTLEIYREAARKYRENSPVAKNQRLRAEFDTAFENFRLFLRCPEGLMAMSMLEAAGMRVDIVCDIDSPSDAVYYMDYAGLHKYFPKIEKPGGSVSPEDMIRA